MKLFGILAAFLSPREQRQGILVLGLVLVMALLDIAGVASIMPFLAVLADPDMVHTNPLLSDLYSRLGFTDTGSFLFFTGAAVFAVLVGSLVFKMLATYAQLRFIMMREYTIGRRLVETYLHQPYAWFLEQNSADLAKNVLSEVNQIINQAMMPMMTLIAQSVTALAILGLLFVVSPELTLIGGIVLVLSYGATYLAAARFLSRIGRERMEANQRRFTTVHESIGAIKDVKIRGLERSYVQAFGHWAEIHARHQASNQVISLVPRFALEAIAFGGMILVILVLMADGRGFAQALPVIGLYAFAGYRLMPSLQQIYSSVAHLRFVAPALFSLHASFSRLASAVEVEAQPNSQVRLSFTNSVRLEGLSYAYPGERRPALHGIDIEFGARKTYGLVGQSGSGKSTIVDILLALLEPQSGRVVVDGVQVTAQNRRAWQDMIGYVPQDIYLNDGTITSNIALGVPPEAIDQAALHRAAKIANLHDFVVEHLPDGYNTRVGERGIRLSGGQRQRIGIARALYHQPRILVLDEATSALDTLTEQAVMDAVYNLGHDITIVLVTHRLTAVQRCDQIYLIEGGRVGARGTYDDLLSTDLTFRGLVGNHSQPAAASNPLDADPHSTPRGSR